MAKSTIFLLIGLLLANVLNAYSVTSYSSLHPVIQFTLYEKNGYRPVSDSNLSSLLPVEYVNMRNFARVYDLEVIKSVPELKELVISPFVTNFDALTEKELPELETIDASFSFITQEDLSQMSLPNLKTLDISASTVKGLDFAVNFPSLETVVFVQYQIDTEHVEQMRKKYPHIDFMYNDSIRPISRNFYFFEFEPFLNVLSPYFANLGRSELQLDVEIEIDSAGNVISSELVTSRRKLDADPTNAIKLLVFAPDYRRQNKTRLLIPLKVI